MKRFLIPVIGLAIMASPALAQPEMDIFGKTAFQQILKNDGVCVLSQHSLSARLTIHAVDARGEVALALDLVEPLRAGSPREDSRTISITDEGGGDRLYGRMRFMIAPTEEGGTRFTAVLPRDFLGFFGDEKSRQLLVKDTLGQTISVRIREGHSDAIGLLEDCSASLR